MAVLFGVALLAAVWIGTVALIRAEQRAAEEQAAASSQELLQTYAAYAVRALREIDLALRTVQFAHSVSDDPRTLDQLKALEVLPPQLIVDVGITSADGVVIASTRDRLGANVSDTDYFIASQRSEALYIDRSRPSGTGQDWKLIFSRRLSGANGSFAGVAFIEAEAAYFVSSYDSDKLGRHGVLALIGTDDTVRVRRIGDDVSAGGRFDWSHVSERTHVSDTASGLVVSDWDGMSRYVSAGELGLFPLSVMVGLAQEEQLETARGSVRRYRLIAASGSGLLIIFVAALGWMGWQVAQSQQREHRTRIISAREAGMAEIATNVLHNVGNTLNSVNVSATVVAEKLKQTKLSGLTRAIALIHEHPNDLAEFLSSDPRGRHLPMYLVQLAQSLQTDQDACMTHLTSMRDSVEHIRQIVMMQQSLAKVSAVRENVDLVELMETSLQMNVDALGRHSVQVVREFDTVLPLTLNKHSVLQILVNLISNAKHACSASARADKMITLRVRRDKDTIVMSVADNGVGIHPESLPQIFQHGFTTKPNGHGFGLHSSAMAARELGGTLHVHSDGVDRGAVFTLTIPMKASAVTS
ncbi:GHKL domain-containing protein [Steroidobacter sp. S1-65]|uniref:histidine kinase n=1 Tax=Steroidobacter gossypii TaxID=2805490 RepID=A0ABS1X3N7_9GAMM|nr:ATP-binding protein [Steroidobacter gossypii]MBM0107836.1 GHKL domain-containing protein [Steroidobacter gossypii]